MENAVLSQGKEDDFRAASAMGRGFKQSIRATHGLCTAANSQLSASDCAWLHGVCTHPRSRQATATTTTATTTPKATTTATTATAYDLGNTLGCSCLRQAAGKGTGARRRGTSHSSPHSLRLSLKRYSKRPCTSSGPSKYSRLSLLLSPSRPVTPPLYTCAPAIARHCIWGWERIGGVAGGGGGAVGAEECTANSTAYGFGKEPGEEA